MNTHWLVAAAVAAISLAGVATQASAQALTRAQVRQELIDAENNGLRFVTDTSYPDVALFQRQVEQMPTHQASTAVGSDPAASSEAGRPATMSPRQGSAACVGPRASARSISEADAAACVRRSGIRGFNTVDRYGTLKEFMMKTYIAVLMMIGAIVGQSAFAQSAAPLTRAQVRDELMRLEAAGYDPAKGDEGSIRRTSRRRKRSLPSRTGLDGGCRRARAGRRYAGADQQPGVDMVLCDFRPSCSRHGRTAALRAARRGRRAPAAPPVIARRFARRRDHLIGRVR